MGIAPQITSDVGHGHPVAGTTAVCRSRAAHARRCALETSSTTERAEWMELARVWSELADSMEFDAPVRLDAARRTSQAFAGLS